MDYLSMFALGAVVATCFSVLLLLWIVSTVIKELRDELFACQSDIEDLLKEVF